MPSTYKPCSVNDSTPPRDGDIQCEINPLHKRIVLVLHNKANDDWLT